MSTCLPLLAYLSLPVYLSLIHLAVQARSVMNWTQASFAAHARTELNWQKYSEHVYPSGLTLLIPRSVYRYF